MGSNTKAIIASVQGKVFDWLYSLVNSIHPLMNEHQSLGNLSVQEREETVLNYSKASITLIPKLYINVHNRKPQIIFANEYSYKNS